MGANGNVIQAFCHFVAILLTSEIRPAMAKVWLNNVTTPRLSIPLKIPHLEEHNLSLFAIGILV